MASTSELQDVRAEIKELKKEVKDLKVQIAAADPSARPELQQELILQLSRLDTLQKKEERLAAQLSAGAASSSGQVGAGAAAGTDMALKKVVEDGFATVLQALQRLGQHPSGTVAASSITEVQLQDVRSNTGTVLNYTSSTGDPHALKNLLRTSSSAAPNSSAFPWGPEPEPDQRAQYSTYLQQNIPTPGHCAWVDVKSEAAKEVAVRNGRLTLSSKNDQLLIIRAFASAPELGALLGVELKKTLQPEHVRQAEAEFYVFANCSQYPYAQLLTDLKTGGVVFYSGGKEHDVKIVNVHTLVGMDAVFAFVSALLQGIPATITGLRIPPAELPTPKRLKLTGAFSEVVSREEAMRMLCGMQSYDIACLEDLDDPALYAHPSPGHAPTQSVVHCRH